MAIPTLAPNSTWFTQGGTTVTRASITEINIVDRYTPTGNETASWDASADKDGSVMCYVNGTKLTIAGNGSGKIYANEDSGYLFFDTAKSDYFKNVTVISGADKLDTSSVTSLEWTFSGCLALESVDVSNWNTDKVTTMYCTFNACRKLPDVAVENWNVSKVTNMESMFQDCQKLTELNLNSWDVSNVANMGYMFTKCTSLQSLNVSNWDTSSCTNMYAMFMQCSALQNIDVSKWDTSNVTTMYRMFGACAALRNLDVSDWDVRNVTDMCYMFATSGVTTLDVSNWDTSSCTTMQRLFMQCSALKSLDVSKWDTSNVTDMSMTFAGCTSLSNLNLFNWDTSKVTTMSNMFVQMTALKKVTLGAKFAFKGAVLPTPSSTHIPGADGNWYDRDRNAYAPAAIPSNTARTYYASLDVLDAEGEISRGALYLLYRIFSPDVFHAMTGKKHWTD